MQYGDTKIINGQLMRLTPVGFMPVKQTGTDQLSIGGVGGGQAFDPSGLQAQIDANKNLLSNLPTFDDTALRDRLSALENREIPTFDPSQLQAGIAGLSERISNIPQFDDRALRERIGAIEDRYTTGFDELNRSIGNIPSYDDSALRDRLSALEGREMPTFDDTSLRNRLKALENRQLPIFDDSALRDRLKALEGREIPTFDPSNLQSGIAGLRNRLDNLNIPEYKAPDLSGFARLEDLPQIDTSKFLTAKDLPKFDPRDFREDFLSIAREGIQLPEYKAPDLSGFARKEDLPVFDKEAFEKEILDKMRGSIDVSPKPPVFDRDALIKDIRSELPAPPAFDPTGLQDRLKQLEERISGLQTPNIMRPPQLPPKRGDQLFIDDRPSDPRIQGGPVALPDLTPTQPAPVTDPVTTAPTPSAPISDQGTDPIQSMPVGALDPVLLGQTSQETLTDPLVRALYFGTADQPGFYQQLQQAGANLIGQDVPLQQTAGLTPLELLARQQAVAGLGGFEPFLQQNRDLVEQAIAQSRRAEELQDPYYTQAEEIYKDTMGAYDPSMTQQFYNPFEQAVVDKTIQDVMEAGEKQDIASRAREISAGAFGGSRARLGAEERREALGEGLAKALGAIRQQGFSEAQRTGLSEFARQQAAKRTGAQGLIGIGTGRGSAASSLGQQLAGYGGELSGLGAAQEQLRAGQRGELAGFGATGRGIAETGLSRIYQQQLGQQQRPLSVLGQIGSMLPGYQQTSTQIGSQYGLPTDPSAAGLGAAFSAYGALAPRQGQS